MSLTGTIKKTLYRSLSLENYLKTLSGLYFTGYRLGLGKRSAAYEYPRFLKNVVCQGDTVIDIGANLGYYSYIFASLAGAAGRVYAVEPVKPILKVLKHNLRRFRNVEILNYALGSEEKTVTMCNDSGRYTGYMGTGRNFVSENGGKCEGDMEFEAEMIRGSRLFAHLDRLDFIKCDIEGYETVVIPEMEPVIARHLPTVLVETDGEKRLAITSFFAFLGYEAYVLADGNLKRLEAGDAKDIFFVHPSNVKIIRP